MRGREFGFAPLMCSPKVASAKKFKSFSQKPTIELFEFSADTDIRFQFNRWSHSPLGNSTRCLVYHWSVQLPILTELKNVAENGTCKREVVVSVSKTSRDAKFMSSKDFVLSKTLKRLMEQRHITLNSLANELSINKSTLHNWLNGVLPQSVVALYKVATFFGLTLDEICFGKESVQIIDNSPDEIKIILEVYDSKKVKLKLPSE